MDVAALVLAAAAAAQAPAPTDCHGALCNSGALRPFIDQLKASPRSGELVHIVQIGDSHTAGDMITNGLRIRLRQRFGNGGRGALPPGRPYPGYLTWGVTASQSRGWALNGIFGSAWSAAGRPVGLTGYTQTSRTPGAALGLSADSLDGNFDRMTVCALKEPGAGTLMLRIGDRSERWELDSIRREAACRSLDSARSVLAATLATEDGRIVSVTSFGVFRKGGGVALSNFGVSGSQLIHQSRQHDLVVRSEMEAYGPALIVLAFGTNEGFSPRFASVPYEAQLRSQIARIRRLAGRDVPILLLGAPDAGTRNPALASNGGTPGAACGSGAWTPSALDRVREVQRRVARTARVGFWDWQSAMGGRCSAIAWTARGLMRGDLVHFTREGGDRVGEMIYTDLIAALGPRPL
ncbi:GDSL-type esterase/lipase family protein [Allosphingosinicella sp.]|uniref:GDSL-type esterase/lipase family protein n=1 Tax=Allosphingosinicella sp. TaxID=2823234 RepID=UPI002F15EB9F